MVFTSFANQANGLVGDEGLLPASLSGGALSSIALFGVVVAVAGVAGYVNASVLAALWLSLLSLIHYGGAFFHEPSDLLLLETGFLALFLAEPLRVRREPPRTSPLPVLWLLRWLLFRITLASGLSKLRGDGCWASLQCFPGYLETVTEPTRFGYLLHALPGPLQQGMNLGVLLFTLVVPFGLFAPRRIRHLAATILMVGYALSILAGGSGYSSWVALALAIPCFDDEWLGRFFTLRAPDAAVASPARAVVIAGVGVVVLGLNVAQFGSLWGKPPTAPDSLEPLHLVNAYETLASLEPERYELVFEGTNDDANAGEARWQPYVLPRSPDSGRLPWFFSPHLWRLDHRLAEAAHADFHREPWTVLLVNALLTGNVAVTALFSDVPFGAKPPRFVHVQRYRYRFSPLHSPAYWVREPVDEYIRAFSLEDPALKEFLARRSWLTR